MKSCCNSLQLAFGFFNPEQLRLIHCCLHLFFGHFRKCATALLPCAAPSPPVLGQNSTCWHEMAHSFWCMARLWSHIARQEGCYLVPVLVCSAVDQGSLAFMKVWLNGSMPHSWDGQESGDGLLVDQVYQQVFWYGLSYQAVHLGIIPDIHLEACGEICNCMWLPQLPGAGGKL